jgi:hypothetical protein
VKVQTWIFAPDAHWPLAHKPTLNALFDFLKRNKVDGFVLGGDQFDNAEISHHNSQKFLVRSKGSYLAHERSFEKNFLTPLESLLPNNATKVWIVGNHDAWESDVAQSQPELAGIADRTKSLKLEDRNWRVIEQGGEYRHGKLTMIHGDVFGGGANHAKKALETFCTNILYGHFHTAQSATKTMRSGHKNKWQAWCSPILGEVNPAYKKSAPSGWLNGFTVIEFHPNGAFNVCPIVVTGGRFAYGGQIYGKL